MQYALTMVPGGIVATFGDKPPDAVRSMLKSWGFRWMPAGRAWHRRGVKGYADITEGLCKLLEPRRPDGECWHCQSPEGYFRAYGAATPVYCDACHAKRRAEERGETERAALDVDRLYEDDCDRRCEV